MGGAGGERHRSPWPSDRDAPTVPHSESHLAILPTNTAEGVGPVDAVVVAAARGGDQLLPAARLARELGAVLVALCSARSQASRVGAVLVRVTGLEWYATDIPTDHEHPLLPLVRCSPGVGGRVSLSRKRNLGLLVARMVGLRTLLFLDDDITEVSADAVRLAAGHLLRCAAVGLAVEDFPDNSVVCHANRLGGGRQTVFVSGSALLVDVHAPELSHFPTVYNEDWLFLFDALAAGRVRREGTARQLRYDPFSRPGRAREEEFGDVVAEGLLAYLELGGRKVPMSRDYWVGFLRRRAAFLARASERLAAGRTTPQRRAALGALAEANARSAEIQPAQIVRFLREWRDDRESWRARLATVESGIGVASALRRLGLGQPNTGRSNLAVVVPGFLDSPANPAHRAIARALELAGLRTVLFTPRGLPIRPGEPFTATATEHLDDLAALLREHAAPDGQVVVVGHSYGAWLAGLLADREERVTHLVALMPTRFFLWPNDYLDSRDTWRRRGEILLSYPEPGSTTLSAVRLPHTLVSDASRYDLPAALGRLRIPVLFVAGTDDTAVPSSSVIRLYDECGSPAKQYVDVPVGHDYRKDPAHIGLVNRCVLEWLGR